MNMIFSKGSTIDQNIIKENNYELTEIQTENCVHGHLK